MFKERELPKNIFRNKQIFLIQTFYKDYLEVFFKSLFFKVVFKSLQVYRNKKNITSAVFLTHI